MSSLADSIEEYIRQRLEEAAQGILEIQRRELAGNFGCAPSQINYVLETRFTPERGYLIESRRGGGGYIRIIRLQWPRKQSATEIIQEEIGDSIDSASAHQLLGRLADSGAITQPQAQVIHSILEAETDRINPPFKDVIRALLLRSLLLLLIYENSQEG
ncbi:MAG: CtsR family transcriptional regulator [Firmicutes bacterium]|nr:CtsR family transcriptional regulator [Bacillota bacterium]